MNIKKLTRVVTTGARKTQNWIEKSSVNEIYIKISTISIKNIAWNIRLKVG